MVKCHNCGAEVVGSDFCFNCGEKVDKNEAHLTFVQNAGQRMIRTRTSVVNADIKLKMVPLYLLSRENGMLNVTRLLHSMISLQRTSESRMKIIS